MSEVAFRGPLSLVLALLVAACSSTPTVSPSPRVSASPTPPAAGPASRAPASPASQAPASPTTGPRGPWVAYQTAEGEPRIRLIQLDGKADHQLAVGSHPAWSPDGDWIAYQVDDRDIWVIRPDGSEARRVFECVDPCVLGDSAAWSPDGRELAFLTADAVGDTAPTGDIVAVDVASGTKRTLFETKGPDYPAYPRWSPDGTSIVVAIQRFATTKVTDCITLGTAIAVVDLAAATRQPRMLTDFALFGDYPDWSPDGRSIVFNTIDQGRRDFRCATNAAQPSDIYTIHPDGSALKQLTHNPTSGTPLRPLGGVATAYGPLSTQPSWTPDGRKIVFTFVDGPAWPGYQIWIMDPDGSNAHSLFDPVIKGSHARLQPGS